jgi:hypothetical protein
MPFAHTRMPHLVVIATTTAYEWNNVCCLPLVVHRNRFWFLSFWKIENYLTLGRRTITFPAFSTNTRI